MFNNPRYMTKAISEQLPLGLQIILWNLIDELRKTPQQLDYLQIFTLSEGRNSDGTTYQQIVHAQEVPSYQRTVTIASTKPISCKIFCIDDKTHSTMLFADEY